jgi:hypothetical protein
MLLACRTLLGLCQEHGQLRAWLEHVSDALLHLHASPGRIGA